MRAVLGPGKGASTAQVEQALHAIRAAWKELQSLLIQTYFMPYALVHLALLSRLATMLTAHHAHLRSTLRLAPVAPVQAQPALLALCASTTSDTALDRIFRGAAAASAQLWQPTSQRKTTVQDSAAGAPLASQPVESSLPAASRDSEDLGEPVPGDEDFGEPVPVETLEHAAAGAEIAAEAGVEAQLMWTVDARPGIVGADDSMEVGLPGLAAPAPAPASAVAAAHAAWMLPGAGAYTLLAESSEAGEAGEAGEAMLPPPRAAAGSSRESSRAISAARSRSPATRFGSAAAALALPPPLPPSTAAAGVRLAAWQSASHSRCGAPLISASSRRNGARALR